MSGLHGLGWTAAHDADFAVHAARGFAPARVTVEGAESSSVRWQPPADA